MKRCDSFTVFFSIFLGLFVLPAVSFAQRIVEIAPTEYGILNKTIDGDVTETGERIDLNTIYVLERGPNAYYLLDGSIENDFPLHIKAKDGDGERPKIVPGVVEGGESARAFVPRADLTLEGCYVTNKDQAGGLNKNMFRIKASDVKLVLDDCYLEYDSQSAFRFDDNGVSVYLTNSVVASIGQTVSPDNGRVFDFRGNDVDTVVIENCTFYNISQRIVRDGGGTCRKLSFNHNTAVNTGTLFLSAGQTVDFSFLNNLVINGRIIGSPIDQGPEALVYLDELIHEDLVGMEQKVDIRHNNFYLDQAIIDAYPDTVTAAVPFDTLSQSYIDAMGTGETMISEAITFTKGPTVPVDVMLGIYEDMRSTGDPSAPPFDEGNPPPFGEAGFGVVPFDFAYPTTTTSYTSATDDQPLGALAWFDIDIIPPPPPPKPQAITGIMEDFNEPVDLEDWRPNTLEHEDGTPVFEVSQEDDALKVNMKQLNFPDGQRYDFGSLRNFDITDNPRAGMKIKLEPGAMWGTNEVTQIPFALSPWEGDSIRQHSNVVFNVPADGEWHEYIFDWSEPDTDQETNPNDYSMITNFLLETVNWPDPHTATFWIDDFAAGDMAAFKGLLGHWSFDEGSGSTAMDASGLGNDGTITGAEWIPGKVGDGALRFDGTTAMVTVPHSPVMTLTDQLTISAWCYLNSTEGNQNVLQKEYMAIGEIREGGFANVLNINNSWLIFNYTMHADGFLGSWHHIAMTYDGTQVVNYLDGQVDTTYSQTGVVQATTADLGIGANSPWNDANFNGNIDDVRLYNIALSASEIEDVFTTEVADQNVQVPVSLELYQNYPNPFNPTTTLEFVLPKTDHVKLAVYDIRGRQVAEMLDERLEAGLHNVIFDAGAFASGVYFYTLTTSDRILTRKMMILK